eukprot:scaffold92595_cov62-Phaeocystis_antarctica.AAC.4
MGGVVGQGRGAAAGHGIMQGHGCARAGARAPRGLPVLARADRGQHTRRADPRLARREGASSGDGLHVGRAEAVDAPVLAGARAALDDAARSNSGGQRVRGAGWRRAGRQTPAPRGRHGLRGQGDAAEAAAAAVAAAGGAPRGAAAAARVSALAHDVVRAAGHPRPLEGRQGGARERSPRARALLFQPVPPRAAGVARARRYRVHRARRAAARARQPARARAAPPPRAGAAAGRRRRRVARGRARGRLPPPPAARRAAGSRVAAVGEQGGEGGPLRRRAPRHPAAARVPRAARRRARLARTPAGGAQPRRRIRRRPRDTAGQRRRLLLAAARRARLLLLARTLVVAQLGEARPLRLGAPPRPCPPRGARLGAAAAEAHGRAARARLGGPPVERLQGLPAGALLAGGRKPAEPAAVSRRFARREVPRRAALALALSPRLLRRGRRADDARLPQRHVSDGHGGGGGPGVAPGG